MAGHSKWSNIKRKEKTDAQKGKCLQNLGVKLQ